MKRLLSGNEGVAYGAWEAGATVGSGYPGTPSTEIMETYAKFPGVYAEWAPNEKVALDVAIGAAYAGARSFATMKHVGLNVAADSLFYVAMTGIEAGLLIVTADDPAMHSSQNEQDNRNYAAFARIPCLEPSDSQEAKDLTIAGFDLSEQFDTPVMIRLTTRISHTSTVVELSEKRQTFSALQKYPRNIGKYVMIPANARRRHPVVEHRIRELSKFAETSSLNFVEWHSAELGIVTSGVSYQYAREVFPNASVLKLGMVYPVPEEMIRKFANSVAKLIVLEELDPFLENQIRLLGIKIDGYSEKDRENGTVPNQKSVFPIFGEFNPGIIREKAETAGFIDSKQSGEVETLSAELPSRPPVLCPGCPHRSTFYILKKMKLPVNGDIGCYTLGVAPPLNTIDTVGCMGASIGVAHGAAVAGDKERHIAVIGDSTFFHTGIPALINVAYNHSNVITVIMDNRITGMTGHQDNPGTGKTLQQEETSEIDIESLVKTLGIKLVKSVDAFKVEEVESTLKEWINTDEPAVLITKGDCALLPSARKRWRPIKIDSEKCNGCTLCFRIGCPAIIKSEKLDEKFNRPLAEIDPLLCTGCEICAQICPRNAIMFRSQMEDKEMQK